MNIRGSMGLCGIDAAAAAAPCLKYNASRLDIIEAVCGAYDAQYGLLCNILCTAA